jgi:hypothetical protein
MRTSNTVKKPVGTDRPQQLLPCLRCSLDWFAVDFSLSFYTIFWSPSPLKPCGYCTCLIMMKHVPFSPNLSAVAWYVLCNDLRDLQGMKEMQTGLSFFRLALLGMGLQQQISKWIPNGWALWLLYLLDNAATRAVLTQPLQSRPMHDTFYVLIVFEILPIPKAKAAKVRLWTVNTKCLA